MMKQPIAIVGLSFLLIASFYFNTIQTSQYQHEYKSTTVTPCLSDHCKTFTTKMNIELYKPQDFFVQQYLLDEGFIPDCKAFCLFGIHYFIDPNPLTTNAGITFLASKAQLTGYATNANYSQYIALTTTAISPAYTDTTLSGEITTNGLQRAVAACSANVAASGSITVTCSKTFTATGTFTAVQGSAIFTSPVTTGIAYQIGTFSSVNMLSGDTLAVSWLSTYNG